MTFDHEQYKADIDAKRWCQFVPKHERPVLSKLIKLALEDEGNTISVFDTEEWVVSKSRDQALIRSMLGHAEEDSIRVRNGSGEVIGWFYLIYNNGSDNDPMVVISDYSANEFSDTLINKLDAQYG